MLLFCGLTFWFQQSEKKAESTYGEISGNGAVREEILEEPEKIEEKPLRCLVIDVGDALSVLVDMGDTEVLYDCGYAKDGKKVSSSIRDYVEGSPEFPGRRSKARSSKCRSRVRCDRQNRHHLQRTTEEQLC